MCSDGTEEENNFAIDYQFRYVYLFVASYSAVKQAIQKVEITYTE